jgi:F-type H+-transporting ATPase subunit gamma
MAGGQERILRRRIRSIESTKKITRAMELIAASQMVRAQGRIAGSRPYVRGVADLLRETAADGSVRSRLVGDPGEVRSALLVAIVADRGLCGAYNASVLRATERALRELEASGASIRLVTVGRKAQAYFRFRSRPVERSFTGMSDRPSFEDARRVAAVVVPPFLAGETDVVELVSTRFVSAGVQVVRRVQLLPVPDVAPARLEEQPGVTPLDVAAAESGETAAAAGLGQRAEAPPVRAGFFEFEPDTDLLLELLVPRYAEASLYGALLEASASEHTARQRAMSSATENAEELIKSLRRVMNRARQDAITTEIMEIVGGAEALRQAARADADHVDHPPSIEENIA